MVSSLAMCRRDLCSSISQYIVIEYITVHSGRHPSFELNENLPASLKSALEKYIIDIQQIEIGDSLGEGALDKEYNYNYEILMSIFCFVANWPARIIIIPHLNVSVTIFSIKGMWPYRGINLEILLKMETLLLFWCLLPSRLFWHSAQRNISF